MDLLFPPYGAVGSSIFQYHKSTYNPSRNAGDAAHNTTTGMVYQFGVLGSYKAKRYE